MFETLIRRSISNLKYSTVQTNEFKVSPPCVALVMFSQTTSTCTGKLLVPVAVNTGRWPGRAVMLLSYLEIINAFSITTCKHFGLPEPA